MIYPLPDDNMACAIITFPPAKSQPLRIIFHLKFRANIIVSLDNADAVLDLDKRIF